MELSSPAVGLSHLAPPGTRLDRGGLFSAIVIGIVGAMVIFITPGFLALVAAQTGLDDQHLGYIAAWDINSMAVTMGLSAFLLTRIDWRIAVAVGLALIALGNVATALTAQYWAIAAARAIAGAGEGIAIGFAFAALGRARKPDRAFSVYLVAGALVSTLLLYFLPQLQEHFSPQLLFVANALLAVLAGVGLLRFPNGAADEEDLLAAGGRVNRTLALGALAAVFLYFFATGAIWGYSERIGTSSGLGARVIATGLSLGTLSGVVGAALAGMLPSRWGRVWPLLASGVVSVASFQLLLGEVRGPIFVLAVVLLLFGWNFAQPLLSGICAEADEKGRVVCAMGSIQTFGVGFGPAAAAATLGSGSFAIAIWSSSMILIASLLIVAVTVKRAQ